jgi:hypothetical protein
LSVGIDEEDEDHDKMRKSGSRVGARRDISLEGGEYC